MRTTIASLYCGVFWNFLAGLRRLRQRSSGSYFSRAWHRFHRCSARLRLNRADDGLYRRARFRRPVQSSRDLGSRHGQALSCEGFAALLRFSGRRCNRRGNGAVRHRQRESRLHHCRIAGSGVTPVHSTEYKHNLKHLKAMKTRWLAAGSLLWKR